MSTQDQDIASSILRRGLVGRFHAGTTPGPALLVLGGLEGGLETADEVAKQFAAGGFASLALAYFGTPPLPAMLGEIPLEYFHKAVDWLHEQPGLRSKRVGVVGHSKGGEAALLIGATAPQVRAIVAYCPSHVAWQALNWQGPPKSSWTFRGVPVPFVRYVRAANDRRQREGWRGFYAACLEADAEAVRAAEIPVERTRGAILLVSGGDDGIWPSSAMARSIIERLQTNSFAYRYQHLEYPDAGHAIMGLGSVPASVEGPWGEIRFGGTEAANASAQVDAWNNVLRFLRDELGD